MRRPWVVWGIALAAYVVAVMNRSSFGVSGVEAASRFDLSPGALASFVFLQVAIYLLMQVPTGLLLDRLGSRTLLATGSFGMAAGQALLAVATSMPLMYVARVVVGAGDALIFVSTLALLPRWFPARRVPLLTQLTATVGQLGQVLSSVPFLALLLHSGWTASYVTVASIGVVVGLLVLAGVRNSPYPNVAPLVGLSVRRIGEALAGVWRQPGTRLGFFSHMGAHCSGMAFALMWGLPYLIKGQGLSVGKAGLLMSTYVAATWVVAPVMGTISARYPTRRHRLVLGVIGATAATWTAVLALSSPAPMWLLTLLVVVLAAGGPGAVVGMDFARTFNHPDRLGLAQSVVNVGGFAATLLLLQVVGVAMEYTGGYTFEAFRTAWLVQYPVWAVASLGVVVQHRRTNRSPVLLGGRETTLYRC